MRIKMIIVIMTLSLLVVAGRFAVASDTDYDASVQTFSAFAITKISDMNFGNISYDAVHSGSIYLGTDGNVSLVNTNGLYLESNAPTNAGAVVVTGGTSSIIEVSCQRSGTMTDGGGNSLRVVRAEVALNTGVPARSGTRCLGKRNVIMTIDTSVTPVPMILMGGRINTNNDAIDGDLSYSTLNSGGSPVELRIVYQ